MHFLNYINSFITPKSIRPCLLHAFVRCYMVKTLGKPFPYHKPYPYKTKKYGYWATLMDKTLWRMNSNSKVIVVDGNLACGKTEVAKRIATDFDLKYFPSPTCDNAFLFRGIDLRVLNSWMTKRMRFCDFDMFYTDDDPFNSMIGLTQFYMLGARVLFYAEALRHLLSTGQGIVIERSLHCDMTFAFVLHKLGHISDRGLERYRYRHHVASTALLPPHLIVYLDAPLHVVRDGLKRRNNPNEVNGKNLTDEYIELYSYFAKNNFIPNYENLCEILTVDVTHGLYPEEVVEKIEKMDLDNMSKDIPSKLQLWKFAGEHDLSYFREQTECEETLAGLSQVNVLWDCPELHYTEDERILFASLMKEHPLFVYEKGHESGKSNFFATLFSREPKVDYILSKTAHL